MASVKPPDHKLQDMLDSVHSHGNPSAASRAVGVPRETVVRWVRWAREKGMVPRTQGLLGNEPHAAPEGYQLKGTSTYINKDGVASGQWIKTDRSLELLQQAQRSALAALVAELVPIPAIKAPRSCSTDLLNLYTLTDVHVGMLAWRRETGEPWDLEIAEKLITGIFIQMIDAAPAAQIGVVNQLGDFLHFDSMRPVTPEHGHLLDADSRYQKVVEVAVRIMRRIVEHALTKHQFVQVYAHEGNHDPAGSVWLRVMFAELYRKNPRVTVEQSPAPYVAMKHGDTFLGFHHGHLLKPVNMPLLFAATFPEMWGTTKFRYAHCGHRHHVEEREHPGLTTVQHPTIAAPDAYAARGGWLSKRQATMICYSKQTGEFSRQIYIPQMLKG